MTQRSSAKGLSGRDLALARRKAMSSSGKSAAKSSSAPDRTRAEVVSRAPARPAVSKPAAAPAVAPAPVSTPSKPRRAATSVTVKRNAALERRKALSTRGKVAMPTKDRVREGLRVAKSAAVPEAVAKKDDCGCGCGGKRTESAAVSAPAPRSKPRGPARKSAISANPGRALSLARRQAQSTRGKAGVSAKGLSAAQTARVTNPDLTGRALAQALREQRSTRGSAGQKKSAPCGRQRPSRTANAQGAAKDQPWKVGVSETTSGQSVTGTMVGRSKDVTGDEASTCRSVTGTEYMGADIFRDFCQAEPQKGFNRVGVSETLSGNAVTGNKVGRSTKVTGDESGTCKSVTGTEYLSAGNLEAFCGSKPEKGPAKVTSALTKSGESVTGNNVGRSGKVTGDEVGSNRALTGTQYMGSEPIESKGKVPPKVGASATLRGGSVSGTMVGRHKSMTGDESGSCRNITGDDYVGQEQYGEFCEATPAPKDKKVGASATLAGERVTGTMTGRASRVTGDEPGTCKAITGTPYAGAEQYAAFCEPDQGKQAAARMQASKRNFGSVMTGLQPGVGGKMTGAAKGACESVSGTPYVGSDQAAAACPGAPAEPGSPDFPQSLGEAAWGKFSVEPPVHAAQAAQSSVNVTGAASSKGHITGPFGMANGKVTGTEEARFSSAAVTPSEVPPEAEQVSGRVKSRITGEGISAGLKITGDDWDRGDRVTGTEGASALVRNPSLRGPSLAMAAAMAKGRDEATPSPVSKVTGSSGNYEGGSLITYSGGARG